MTLGRNLSNFATNIEAKSSLEHQSFWSAYVLVSSCQSYSKEVSHEIILLLYMCSIYNLEAIFWRCLISTVCVFLRLRWNVSCFELRDQSMFPVSVTRFPRVSQFTVILRVSARVTVSHPLPWSVSQPIRGPGSRSEPIREPTPGDMWFED